MTAAAELSDYEWLVSPAALAALELAAQGDHTGLAAIAKLRKQLSPARAHLVLDLLDLRERAKTKFSRVGDMYFTRQALEQASDEHVAAYKAARFPRGALVGDLGCGIGGDLLGLAARGPVFGAEQNGALALMAAANCRVHAFANARVEATAVETLNPHEFEAWHCDPDRRATGSRTTELEFSAPSLAELERWRAAVPHAAVKLAPAAEPPPTWASEAELEWIGHDRECKQLVAWFGALARTPGRRFATVIDAHGQVACTFTGDENVTAPLADRLEKYIYEPHAAVLAAHLGGALAAAHGLAQVVPGVAYFTGASPLSDGGLTGFEIFEALPFDVRRLKARLRELGIGRLEIKKRGLPLDPAEVRRKLELRGTEAAVLILTHVPAGPVMALLAQRLPEVDDKVKG